MYVSPGRSLARIAAAFATSTMMLGLAVAGTTGSIQTTVQRLTPAVTYSDSALTPPLVTYIGYTVKFANVGKNTTNSIRLEGTIGSTADDPEVVENPAVKLGSFASFEGPEGVRCDPLNTAKTQVRCTFRQLKAGASVEFAIFFKAPSSNAPIPNGLIDSDGVCTGDCAVFNGTTFYAEGAPIPINSTDLWEADHPVALGTANAVLVKSAVPKTGGTLFTGFGAAPTSGDDVDWLTVVQIPPGSNYTTATIEESFDLVTCSSYLVKCNSTTLTIPGSFPSTNLTDPKKFTGLKIFIRLDESQRVKGVQIRSAVLYYSQPSHPAIGIDYTANGGLGFIIPACTNTDYNGPLPQPGIPCLKNAVEYTKKNAPSDDYLGDWDFEVWAIDNGKIQM